LAPSTWIGAGLSAAFMPVARVPVTMTSETPGLASAAAASAARATVDVTVASAMRLAPTNSLFTSGSPKISGSPTERLNPYTFLIASKSDGSAGGVHADPWEFLTGWGIRLRGARKYYSYETIGAAAPSSFRAPGRRDGAAGRPGAGARGVDGVASERGVALPPMRRR
jgi:hypothetical protein